LIHDHSHFRYLLKKKFFLIQYHARMDNSFPESGQDILECFSFFVFSDNTVGAQNPSKKQDESGNQKKPHENSKPPIEVSCPNL
jgi:hypothetical protein